LEPAIAGDRESDETRFHGNNELPGQVDPVTLYTGRPQ
jgi:hypothetical protein